MSSVEVCNKRSNVDAFGDDDDIFSDFFGDCKRARLDESEVTDATGMELTESDSASLAFILDELECEKDIHLSTEQYAVVERVIKTLLARKTGRPICGKQHLFVTGGAGSGKSYLLRGLRDVAMRMGFKTIVCAHQGVAALNVGGTTICSEFKPHLKYISQSDREAFGAFDLVIIDEISMVSAQMLENTVAGRLVQGAGKKCKGPFGNALLVVMGDLMQLAPVGKDALPVFDCALWRREFDLVNLTENHRQKDGEIIEHLNALRWGDRSCLTYFNRLLLRVDEARDWLDVPHLMSTNRSVAAHNENRYEFLVRTTKPAEQDVLVTSITEGKPVKAREDRKFPSRNEAMEQLSRDVKLCRGTVVMVTANDTANMAYCNGDLGVVENILQPDTAHGGHRAVVVRLNRTGRVVKVMPISVNYDDGRLTRLGMVGTVCGYPLVHGWAITIHKSQGLSMDRVVVDPRGIFAPAQLYVALSRARTPEGLKLAARIQPSHVKVDARAAAEYVRLSQNQGESEPKICEVQQQSSEARRGVGDDEGFFV